MKQLKKINWLDKNKSETNSKYGCEPHKRPIEEHIKNSIVIIDKPAGPTSHQAASWVRDMFAIKKTGHSGTLDPQVTGVLVCTLDNASKTIPFLSGHDKEYICLMQIHKSVEEKKLITAMKSFEGLITQMPPVKSAVKRVNRKRRINEIEVLDIQENDVLFRVKCQAGTYIRVLCCDIGRSLGVGAHMSELRRTNAGPFKEIDAVTLHDLRDAYENYKTNGDETKLREILLPVEFAAKEVPKIMIKDSAVSAVCHGANLSLGGISKFTDNITEGNLVAILTLKGELVAIGKSVLNSTAIDKKRSGIACTINRVIMKEDTYPRMWKENLSGTNVNK
ncbi:MAG: RNA-guided pseudouridylation complex pseudouridine synthase subunit Cbf5 [Candidatus Aenigmarchaeota archaeon]|nr:RNA-guided pseudouridylation complex pseudouridine synthase subunit Cbf5 [Candidatus Aenigmarchaeota archaeon]